uniref:Uncharacterized protein n=1 Tax=Timema genevievae TaxID=629358 RepID=A0A7R9JZ37_TIMGE|nr:unnamed protein product [Timema genevievae]
MYLLSNGVLVQCDREPPRKLEYHFGENTLSTPDQDSSPDLLVISSLVYCESEALNPAATRVGQPKMSGVAKSGSLLAIMGGRNMFQTTYCNGGERPESRGTFTRHRSLYNSQTKSKSLMLHRHWSPRTTHCADPRYTNDGLIDLLTGHADHSRAC